MGSQESLPEGAEPERIDIRIFRDAQDLFHAAAELISAELRAALAGADNATFVLAGGSTPRGAYELLAAQPYRSRVSWQSIHVFWGDERCVQPDSSESNYRLAQDALLSRVAVPEALVHRIPAELEDPAAASLLYEAEIRRILPDPLRSGFDLLLLGLGGDGHTASLFPGMQFDETRLVVPSMAPSFPSRRISMTPGLMNSARRIVFLVSGNQKAPALARVIEDPFCQFPAARIRPATGRLTWMVDRAAATLLSRGSPALDRA
jgi:6-phosphogluconolactonase